MRLDAYLSENGLAKSRTKAKELIESGLVTVGGVVEEKPSASVGEGETVEVLGDSCPFVGRGGLKLDGALDRFGISPDGLVCADIGASTGGFTDCLLSRGAAHVYAIDAGHGQLDESLRSDNRVTDIEGCNARTLSPDTLGEPVSLAVADLSFISLTLVLGAISSILTDDGLLVALIKPQFECGRSALSKNGIVRDRKHHIEAIRRVVAAASSAGLGVFGLMPSPIPGGDGNREFLIAARRGGIQSLTEQRIREVAHE